MTIMDEQILQVIDYDINMMKLKEGMIYVKISCTWFFTKKDNNCKEVVGKLIGKNVLGELRMLLRERAARVRKGELSYPAGFLLD